MLQTSWRENRIGLAGIGITKDVKSKCCNAFLRFLFSHPDLKTPLDFLLRFSAVTSAPVPRASDSQNRGVLYQKQFQIKTKPNHCYC
jgi:hypothetical protein